MVPIHDSSQVNLHLASKTEQVKTYALPYVANDFEVLVHDLKSFDAVSRQHRALQRRSIALPSKPPTHHEINEWADASNPLVSNLSRKLGKRVGVHDRVELEEAVRDAIGWFLERENALETLRQNAPELHEAIFGVISRYSSRLSFCGPPPHGTPHDILRTQFDSLTVELRERVPNFSPDSAEKMIRGTVADLLLRCPLDFPPYDHAA